MNLYEKYTVDQQELRDIIFSLEKLGMNYRIITTMVLVDAESVRGWFIEQMVD